jgi:low temperature requirement protein LtrA
LVTAAISVALYALELIGPYIAELRVGRTPWHVGHIVERYGLFTIICLGETILGTVTASAALISDRGWNAQPALLAIFGVALAFALWATYFILPSETVLRARRRKAFLWGYAHMLLFTSIAAVGAGLHVVAYGLGGDADLSRVQIALTVIVPVAIYCTTIFGLYFYLIGRIDPYAVSLMTLSLTILAIATLACSAGASVELTLLLTVASPTAALIGNEVRPMSPAA